MDYNSLIGDVNTSGSIKRWVNWSRVDSEGILTEAETWIFGRLRVQEMIATADVAIALNDTFVAFPTGYLDPIHFGIPGQITTLFYRDPERFRALLGWDGSSPSVLPIAVPSAWCDIDRRINFNSRSDAAYSAQMVFYKKPAALSGSNLTNFLTDRFPSLLRYVCTKFAHEERKDREQENNYELRAMAEIERIRAESDLSLRGMSMDFHWNDGEYC